ncbi:uncharacterized protein LOC106667495 [Cimex lectularius]|uniref:Uncharacterized protein n=1 Tax=Cimex lectularius TaxID=79782 RepID=A0A8I6RVG3_CIMLE|nr:uncharacterized protein LOC106667495 [Cimex lectularius]
MITVAVVLTVLCLVFSPAEGRKTVIDFEKVENCKGFKGLAVLEGIEIVNLGLRGTGLNALVNITGPIPDKIKASVDASKCKSAEDGECEHFVHTNHDFCQLLRDKKQFYTPLFDAVTPRPFCPVKKGVFRVSNATMASNEVVSLIKFVPSYMNIHWRITVKAYPAKSKEVLLCIVITFKLKDLRE